ncbi:hypothetical protein OH816_23445, partial [Chryseobacterium sp. CFS7]|uniref:hypothetical protein n=1 Tax=Chryseobacterium sp. CFS7 TaxID=2986941 RepID=UPI0028535A0C
FSYAKVKYFSETNFSANRIFGNPRKFFAPAGSDKNFSQTHPKFLRKTPNGFATPFLFPERFH